MSLFDDETNWQKKNYRIAPAFSDHIFSDLSLCYQEIIVIILVFAVIILFGIKIFMPRLIKIHNKFIKSTKLTSIEHICFVLFCARF